MTDRLLVSLSVESPWGTACSPAARQQLQSVFLQPVILLDSILYVATKLLKFILSAFPWLSCFPPLKPAVDLNCVYGATFIVGHMKVVHLATV